MLIAMRKLGHKKKMIILAGFKVSFASKRPGKNVQLFFTNSMEVKKKMITLNQTKQKQANEADGHEALHI